MAVPMQMAGVGDLLMEIVDDTADREWSEDDRLLVMEVASQLALALDKVSEADEEPVWPMTGVPASVLQLSANES